MRYYNRGKFLHIVGRHKDTGEMVQSERDLAPDGYDIGTAIVNFPGHGFRKAVAPGEFIEVPDDIHVDVVKSQCPSLLTEAEAKPLIDAADKAKAEAEAKTKAAAKAAAKADDKGAKGAKDKE